MITTDPFSQYYGDFLDGTYDCVDRIVLNAYFPLGCSPGGFRVWWRLLYGSDANLDNTHLMRLAGRFARRVYGWAKKNQVPVIYCKRPGTSARKGRRRMSKRAATAGRFLCRRQAGS